LGWEWSAFDDCHIVLAVLKDSDKAIVPAGVFHTVFTVFLLSSGSGPQSVAMSGSHFLSRFTMVQSLYAAISFAIWKDVWPNAEHDDRDYTIAKMLVWQARSRGRNTPFKGKNLYALLMFGKLHHHLRWDRSRVIPDDFPDNDPIDLEAFADDKLLQDVREYMSLVSDHIVYHMKPLEREVYTEFWREAASFYLAELESRKQYQLQVHSK